MAVVKFSDIKDKLQKILEEKLKTNPITGENGFSLIDGFMNVSLQKELSNNLTIGGPIVPTVGLVGNTSGRIYTFALKALLPEIEI